MARLEHERVPAQALSQEINEVAGAIPVEVLVSWSLAATEWDASYEHYDPNFDRVRIAGKPEIWARHPEWAFLGPTCEEFFLFHPERELEWLDGRDYNWVAQTTLASSYGPFGLPYAQAFAAGYTGAPDGLKSVDEGTRWAVTCLEQEIERAEALGRESWGALAFAIMSVGSWIPSRRRLAAFEEAHRRVYGTNFFGG